MAEQVIRPTVKLIAAGFVVVFLLEIAAVVVWVQFMQDQIPWLPAACALLSFWPVARLLRRQFTVAVLEGDTLRYRTGFLTRSSETMQLSKMQSVKVRQTLGQRILDVGDISLETAGETSRLTIPNVDAPQALADTLMAAIRRTGAAGAAR